VPLYVKNIEEAKKICKSISPCFICKYDWCDVAVEDQDGITVLNARKPLVKELDDRLMLYQLFKKYIKLIADNLGLEYDPDVLTAVVSNFQMYGYPKCVCANRVCPCSDLLLILQGVKKSCLCGLFRRNPHDKPQSL